MIPMIFSQSTIIFFAAKIPLYSRKCTFILYVELKVFKSKKVISMMLLIRELKKKPFIDEISKCKASLYNRR
jgi:hypothetical protein